MVKITKCNCKFAVTKVQRTIVIARRCRRCCRPLDKNFTLVITYEPQQIGLSYFTCLFLMTRPFTSYHNFDIVTLTLKFDLLFKNFNLCRTLMNRERQGFQISHVYSL